MLSNFEKNLKLFKFRSDSLFWVKNKAEAPSAVRFFLEEAEKLNVDAVYFRWCQHNTNNILPFIYIYNNSSFQKHDLGELCRRNWNAGNVPLTFVFEKRQTIILNNMQMPKYDSETNKPVAEPFDIIDFASNIKGELDAKIRKYSAQLFDTGTFWNSEGIQDGFKRSGGSYELLLSHLKVFRGILIEKATQNIARANFSKEKHEAFIEKTVAFINKLIVLCIFVKYLEEKGDGNDKVFQKGFFDKFNGNCFCETLRDSEATIQLFAFLSKKFNGRVFSLCDDEHPLIKYIDLGIIADFLDGCIDNIHKNDDSIYYQYAFWRLYSFRELNIEFMSNLYEEFVIGDKEKNENGVVYTPHHLVQFIIDEVMPINSIPPQLESYRVLDPACGSGIFLVGAFKRLVQWWRIKNNWREPSAEELIKIIKNSIHGVDKSGDALKVAVFSLYLSVCDNLTPKMIWEKLTFEDLLERNFIENDFFNTNISSFDVIIGNPPFEKAKKNWSQAAKNVDDSLSETDNSFRQEYDDKGTQQLLNNKRYTASNLAMLFFEESVYRLKKHGMISLVLPSSPLLYNKGAIKYRNYLFSNFNIPQIIDFTHLNRTLFEGRGDISICVLFGQKKEVNLQSEILHIVVKRTKPAKEKLYFEIDYYDFHYIPLLEAISNEYIWKANYWGGGRLCNFTKRFSQYDKLKHHMKDLKDNNQWQYAVGIPSGALRKKKDKNNFKNIKGAYNLTPTSLLSSNGINYKELIKNKINEDIYVNEAKDQLFTPPVILIRTTIEVKSKEISFDLHSDGKIYFGKRIIGISSPQNDIAALKDLYNKLQANMKFLKLYMILTSYDFSTGTSSGLDKEDFDNLPWDINNEKALKLTEVDEVFLDDIFSYILPLKRKGEQSIALEKIGNDNLLEMYSKWFCDTINSVYGDEKNIFQAGLPFVTDAFVCHHFYYGESHTPSLETHNEDTIKALLESEYESLIIKRLIKYYDKNSLVIIKPNEKRYWLRSIAIRDADDTINDFIQKGF
jgi:Eco57I restriction-modification methylase